MKNIKLWFGDFWPNFDKSNNLFIYALSQKYNVIVTSENPDIVITDDSRYRYQNAKMVYFSGEPFFDLGQCDYAFTSFYVNDSKFFRVPLYFLYAYDYYKYGIIESFDAILKKDISNFSLKDKINFCAYIARGPGQHNRRTEFFNKLNQYKFVNALGSHFNNTPSIPGNPGTIEGSIEKYKILKQYKFCMSFENTNQYNECIGYTTEKIYEPMMSLSIPIYWGNSEIYKDFNIKSFINWNDYGSDENVIERIIEIDNDDDLYMDYIKENYSANDQLFKIDYMVNIFEEILK